MRCLGSTAPGYTVIVGRRRAGQGARRWHLTPAGWALTVALLVFIVLAIVDPGRGVFAGLILVVIIWAVLLGMSFPSGRARGMYRGDVGRSDFGGDAERDRR
jgi:hypothetical protein